VKGEVIVVPFPFSDLSQAKRRPALVLAALRGEDVILCQITSQVRDDPHAIPLENVDFASGGLRQSSHIRPGRIFTADSHIILYTAGRLSPAKLEQVVDAVCGIIRQ
jgi:mRNA interferase MazF